MKSVMETFCTEYQTETRANRVSDIREHFPRSVHIFERWCSVTYNDQIFKEQPIDLEMELTNDQPNDDEDNNNNEFPQIIQETPPSQMPTPVIKETPHSQVP